MKLITSSIAAVSLWLTLGVASVEAQSLYGNPLSLDTRFGGIAPWYWADPNIPYIVEASDDGESWTVIDSFLNSGSNTAYRSLTVPALASGINQRFYRLSIDGTYSKAIVARRHIINAGTDHPSFSTMGLDAKPAAISGVFEGVTGSTLTDNDVDFTAALWATGFNPPFLLEIVGGNMDGAIQEISSVNGNSIVTANNLAVEGLQSGAAYIIREIATLDYLLGAQDSQHSAVRFAEINSITGDFAQLEIADRILVPNPEAQGSFDHYVFVNDYGSSFEGWARNPEPFQPLEFGGGDPIVYTDSIIWKRFSSDSSEIITAGEVRDHQVTIPLHVGFNYIGHGNGKSINLEQSGLADQLASAWGPAGADHVMIPKNGVNSYGFIDYDQYYYNPGITGWIDAGWYQTNSYDPILDPSSIDLTPGFVILRSDPSPTNVTIKTEN